MDESVATLLRSWGMSQPVIDNFTNQQVTIGILRHLTEETIQGLIPLVGPRCLFSSKLKEFILNEKSAPPKEPSESSPGPSSESTAVKRSTCILHDSVTKKPRTAVDDLKDLPSVNSVHSTLKGNTEGLSILAYFKKCGILDNRRRDELCTVIIYNELKPDLCKRITKERCLELADEIVQLFPTESATTWCDVEVKKKRVIVSGRLRHKFYNIRRNLISVGLISTSRLKEELALGEEIDLDINADDDEDILWLKTHDSPYTEVLDKWNRSADIRKVLSKSLTISQYIQTFPFLCKPHGFELLVHESNENYPDWKDRISTHWPKFMDFVESQLLKVAKPTSASDSSSREHNEERTVHLLAQISQLFKPRTLPKSRGASKNTKAWRPSRAEVQSSIFLQINEPGKLQDIIKAREETLFKFKETIQPFVVAIGPTHNVRQYLIVIDKKQWEISSALEGIDACFKVFFALNSGYPSEARHVWLLIQRCVYDLELAEDYDGDKGLKSFLASTLKDCASFFGKNSHI